MDIYSKSLCCASRVTGRPRIMCWLFSLCQINSEGLLKDASFGLSCYQKYYTSWSWGQSAVVPLRKLSLLDGWLAEFHHCRSSKQRVGLVPKAPGCHSIVLCWSLARGMMGGKKSGGV